ncbi:hypothetical protein PSPO01_14829 [Paraphaeosphaeria sporulosa]
MAALRMAAASPALSTSAATSITCVASLNPAGSNMASDCALNRAQSPEREEPHPLEDFSWQSIHPSLQPGLLSFEPSEPPPASLHGPRSYENIALPHLTTDTLREHDRQLWEHGQRIHAETKSSPNTGPPTRTVSAATVQETAEEQTAPSYQKLTSASDDMPPKTKKESVTEKSSPYDANFEAKLRAFHIFFPADIYDGETELEDADDADAIITKLKQPRTDLEHVTKDTLHRLKALCSMGETNTIASGLYALLAPEVSARYDTDFVFNNLAPLTRAADALTAAKPDYCIGATASEISKEFRDAIDRYIQPSTRNDDRSFAPTVPSKR